MSYMIDLEDIIRYKDKNYVALYEKEEVLSKEELAKKFQMENIATVSYRDVTALLQSFIISRDAKCERCFLEKECEGPCYKNFFNFTKNNFYRKHEFVGETLLVCDECPFQNFCSNKADYNHAENCLDIITQWYLNSKEREKNK